MFGLVFLLARVFSRFATQALYSMPRKLHRPSFFCLSRGEMGLRECSWKHFRMDAATFPLISRLSSGEEIYSGGSAKGYQILAVHYVVRWSFARALLLATWIWMRALLGQRKEEWVARWTFWWLGLVLTLQIAGKDRSFLVFYPHRGLQVPLNIWPVPFFIELFPYSIFLILGLALTHLHFPRSISLRGAVGHSEVVVVSAYVRAGSEARHRGLFPPWIWNLTHSQ